MLEHEQNMIALNDHLQMTRLRQQKRFANPLLYRKQVCYWVCSCFNRGNIQQSLLRSQYCQRNVHWLFQPAGRALELGYFPAVISVNSHVTILPINVSSFYRNRLEQRLATRRARLAELRQQMEKEREEQSQNDPEAMKTLTRVQVTILLYSTLTEISVLFVLFVLL